MRATFLTLCFLALTASATGLFGIWRHDTRALAFAMERLPAPWGPYLQHSAEDAEAVAARDGVPPEEREAAPQRHEMLQVQAYFAHRFPNSVRGQIDAACPEPARRAPAHCFAAISSNLARVGKEEAKRQGHYKQLLLWSRVLWGAAMVLGLLMLFRAYDQIRRSDRRLSRPDPMNHGPSEPPPKAEPRP